MGVYVCVSVWAGGRRRSRRSDIDNSRRVPRRKTTAALRKGKSITPNSKDYMVLTAGQAPRRVQGKKMGGSGEGRGPEQYEGKKTTYKRR